MAGGGKVSVRQQMINMMYLVLTALLALQVSNAVLDKFVFIDRSLQNSLKIARQASSNTLEGIRKKATESGRGDDMAVLKRAETVKKLTDETQAEIDKIRKELLADGRDWNPEIGAYPEAKNYDIINKMMLIGPEATGEKGGFAYKLRPVVNKFVEDLAKLDTGLQKSLTSANKIPLLKDPKDMDEFKSDPNQVEKDWERMSFENTPFVAALAVLSQVANEIAKVETEAMEKFAALLGATQLKFDVVQAKVTAESKAVAAGTKYKASMFIAASASNIVPKMTSSAGPVKVDPATGVGEIEFTAQAGGTYDDQGRIKKKWTGSITIPNPRGGDTTFTVDEEYIVVQPVLDIQSASVSALYFKCGNELNIQVPALGVSYDPKITASEAEVIPGGKKGLITIIPNAAKTKITVYSGGNLIGERTLNVKIPPKPEIEVRNNKKKVDEKMGGPCPRQVEVVAVPDESFKSLLPKDARYMVTEGEWTLARGKRAIASGKITGTNVDLGGAASQAQPGDRIVFEIKGCVRKNFKDQVEKVNIGTKYVTYPIN
jgi:gliding motility-associated protein GldM